MTYNDITVGQQVTACFVCPCVCMCDVYVHIHWMFVYLYCGCDMCYTSNSVVEVLL